MMSEELEVKNGAKIYSICFTMMLFLLQSHCFIISAKNNYHKYDKEEIYQNGKIVVGKDNIFYLDTTTFSIRFYNKEYDPQNNAFYCARLTSVCSKDQLPEIEPGLSVNDIPCFQPGTGMAASRKDGYTALSMNAKAHHYLFYEDEKSKRINKIGENGDYSLFEFVVDTLNFWGEMESMQETQTSQFYLLLLVDRNLNNIVDEGEYQVLTLRIKKNYKGWDRCFWNIQDKYGNTPLDRLLAFDKWTNVTEKKRCQILNEALACKDINLNLTDDYGNTALHYAVSTYYFSGAYNEVKRNSIDIIKTLLKRPDIDINRRSFSYLQTPILNMVSEERNNYNNQTITYLDSVINLFLERQDLNLTYRNNINESVCDYKPDFFENGIVSDTLYNDNASWEMIKIIEQLGYSETLDDTAFFKKNINICFEYKADPDFYYDAYNYTPLIWLCSTNNRPYGYSLEEIDDNLRLRNFVLNLYLQNPSIDVNMPDQEGNSPLHYAAKNFNYLLINTLLQDKHIDSERTDAKGNTPLMALLESLQYCDFEEFELQALLAFMEQKEKMNFKVVNFQGNTIVDIIDKKLLVGVHKDWLKKKHSDIYEELNILREYAASRMKMSR